MKGFIARLRITLYALAFVAARPCVGAAYAQSNGAPMVPSSGICGPMVPGSNACGPMVPITPASSSVSCSNSLDFSQACNSQYINVVGS